MDVSSTLADISMVAQGGLLWDMENWGESFWGWIAGRDTSGSKGPWRGTHWVLLSQIGGTSTTQEGIGLPRVPLKRGCVPGTRLVRTLS